jgi:broad specificity phosphatase PhoE
MRLYLITHAHTQQVREVAVTRWHLSASGAHQAQVLAQQPFWSQVQQIVLSSEAKTWLTVEAVLAQYALPVLRDARFDELRRGAYGNFDYAERVGQAFAHPEQPAEDWEPASAAQSRFLAGLADLCQQQPQATLALVGHGLTLSLYRAWLLGAAQVALADWRNLSFAAVALVDPLASTLLQDFQPVAGESRRG